MPWAKAMPTSRALELTVAGMGEEEEVRGTSIQSQIPSSRKNGAVKDPAAAGAHGQSNESIRANHNLWTNRISPGTDETLLGRPLYCFIRNLTNCTAFMAREKGHFLVQVPAGPWMNRGGTASTKPFLSDVTPCR